MFPSFRNQSVDLLCNQLAIFCLFVFFLYFSNWPVSIWWEYLLLKGYVVKVKATDFILHESYVHCHKHICDVLRNLVPFVQLKTWKTPMVECYFWVRLQPTTLLKVTLLHGCSSRFLNRTNETKWRKASHL